MGAPGTVKHIGIVAVSPEGSALFYREIFRRAADLIGAHGHPPVTLHNEPLETYLAAVLNDDWQGVGELLARSAEKLAQAGADFCVLPDNLMQHGAHIARADSPIPWLTMTDLIADAIQRDGKKIVGLIGPRRVTASSIYQGPLGVNGVQVLIPEEAEMDAVDRIIFGELVFGVVKDSSRTKILQVIDALGQRGCEGVILGSTEAPLVVDAANSPIQPYDPAVLLAEGAVRCAIGEREIES